MSSNQVWEGLHRLVVASCTEVQFRAGWSRADRVPANYGHNERKHGFETATFSEHRYSGL